MKTEKVAKCCDGYYSSDQTSTTCNKRNYPNNLLFRFTL